MTLGFEVLVADLQSATGCSRERAETVIRANLVSRGEPAPAPAGSERDARAEKQVERDGDVLMQKLGFEVVKFSHPGKTRQTEGIPDRRYYRRPRIVQRRDGNYHEPAIIVWVEYKSATGRQRPGQKVFQEMAEACGEAYVLGGIAELRDYLIALGIAVEL